MRHRRPARGTCRDRGERELGHCGLVVANPRQHGVVGVEIEGTTEGELLLVNPVGLAVDDAVELAVGGDLTLGIVVYQLDKEEVVVAHECYHGAVLGESRYLLRASVGEGHEGAVAYIIYIVYGCEGVAVDGSGLCAHEDGLLVGTEDVVVDGREAHVALGVGNIEEDVGLLARLERRSRNLTAVGAELCVAHAVVHGAHT